MAALSVFVHILAAAQGLLLLLHLVGSLLHDRQPGSLSDVKKKVYLYNHELNLFGLLCYRLESQFIDKKSGR